MFRIAYKENCPPCSYKRNYSMLLMPETNVPTVLAYFTVYEPRTVGTLVSGVRNLKKCPSIRTGRTILLIRYTEHKVSSFVIEMSNIGIRDSNCVLKIRNLRLRLSLNIRD